MTGQSCRLGQPSESCKTESPLFLGRQCDMEYCCTLVILQPDWFPDPVHCAGTQVMEQQLRVLALVGITAKMQAPS